MSKPDRRPRILAGAMRSKSLTATEKLVVFALVELPPQRDDQGQRRQGSRGMDRRGQVALHLDYIGLGVGLSSGAVKRALRSLVAKGVLEKVHEGTFGRPSLYRAFDVRVSENGRVTPFRNCTPYDLEYPFARGSESEPLALRVGTHSDHPPAFGLSPQPRVTGQAAAGRDSLSAPFDAAVDRRRRDEGSNEGEVASWPR